MNASVTKIELYHTLDSWLSVVLHATTTMYAPPRTLAQWEWCHTFLTLPPDGVR